MTSSIRNVFQVAVAVAAVGMSSIGWAGEGVTGRLSERGREQRSEQRSNGGAQSRPESRPARDAQPARSGPVREPARREQPVRSGPERPAPAASASAAAPAPAAAPRERSGIERLMGRDLQSRDEPRQVRPAPAAAQAGPANPGRGNANDNRGNRPDNNGASRGNNDGRLSDRGADRGLTGGLIQREYQTSNGRGNDRPRGNGNWDRDDRRNAWNDHDRRARERQWHRDHRPGRVIHRLPSGYRDYSWGGRRYYYHGGSWYQPYGGTYISVGIPYGMFVSTLPGAYSSFWFGSTRYYYSDYNYYTYEPARRGYVIVKSPYDDEYYDEDSRQDQDLYIYPARGQSEQQQADDRYECHRWGASETDYDPIDDEYDADRRQEYLRAMTACLTGRGYTVR
jgi:hypothetical protein